MGALDRRYAFVGWIVWKLAKRRLRGMIGRDSGGSGGRRLLRWIAAVGVFAGLAALWATRRSSEQAPEL